VNSTIIKMQKSLSKRFQLLDLNLVKLIGAGVRDSCGKSESKGDPTGASAPRRLPDRPRKASALRSNQRPNLCKQKNCSQTRFSSSL